MRMAYYPGCSLEGVGIEYNLSMKAVAKHVGLELWEIPDWCCCGSSPGHNTNHLLGLALPARNLAIAEKEGLDVAVPCAACYSRMKAASLAVRQSESMKQKIAEIIEMDIQGTVQIRNVLDVMINVVGLSAIQEKVVKPLTGLKVASYYGCLLVRPPEIAEFDDVENPMSMDQIVESLGGTPVDWAYKVECCGAGLTSTMPKAAIPMVHNILQNAYENGADCIAVACPMCFVNLDMHQADAKKKFGAEYSLPIFYITELMGVAFGYAPKDLGLGKHFVNPMPLIDSKEILRHPSARREEA